MIWQDLVVALCVVVFTLTTLPMLRHRVRVPLMTSVPMVVGALVLTVVYLTLGLWWSAGVEIVAATMWAALVRVGLA